MPNWSGHTFSPKPSSPNSKRWWMDFCSHRWACNSAYYFTYVAFLKRFPDADMYESVCMLFGNKFGKLLGFLYVFISLLSV